LAIFIGQPPWSSPWAAL